MIRVLLFGQLRDLAGERALSVACDGQGLSLEEILAELARTAGETLVERLRCPDIRFAVDDALTDEVPDRLVSGQTLAFLPPVTGG